MSDAGILNLVLWLPVIGIALLIALPADRHGAVRQVTLWVMLAELALAVCLYAQFDAAAGPAREVDRE
jgi:NADH-quinone oxidoreductase subunit M